MDVDEPDLPPAVEKQSARDATIRLTLAGLGLVAALAIVVSMLSPVWKR